MNLFNDSPQSSAGDCWYLLVSSFSSLVSAPGSLVFPSSCFSPNLRDDRKVTPSQERTLPPVPGWRCPGLTLGLTQSLPAHSYCPLLSRTSVPFNLALPYFLSECDREARRTWSRSVGPFGEAARVWSPSRGSLVRRLLCSW